MLSAFEGDDETELALRGLVPPLVCFLVAGIAAGDLFRLVVSWKLQQGAVLEGVAWLTLEVGVTVLAGRLAFLLFKPGPSVPVWPSLLRFALAAAWFGPAALLARMGPWGAVFGGCGVAVILARCLRVYWFSLANREEGRGSRRTWGFAAAVLLQTGIVALWIGYPGTSVWLTGLACFVVAWRHASQPPQQTMRTRARSLIVVFLLMICGFTLSRQRPGPGSAGLPVAKAGAPQQNLLTGVILLSEPKRYVLRAPVPLLNRKGPVQPLKTRPTSIPFNGEYWLFPSLYREWQGRRFPVSQRPPVTSLVEHSDPIASTFTSIRRWMPLVMKAHQTLGEPVELSCCGRIDVAVIDADTLPGTVLMELILLDTTKGRRGSQSLGETALTPSLPETMLRFDVPSRANINRFDAIEVVFNLLDPRRDKSAKLAIDRFDLVPRLR
jgi:hypothetical protein